MGIQGPKLIPEFPFPAWSLTLPPALAFPREPFAEELATHAHVFEAHKRQVLEALVEAATSVEPNLKLADLGTIIEVEDGKPSTLEVGSRGELATYLERYRGLLHPLLRRPLGPMTFVAIATENVISLHLAEVTGIETETFAIVLAKREIAFEPVAIDHRTSTTLHVTSWDAPDETRYAWVLEPDEPASEDEAVDRFVMREEATIRAQAAAFAAENPGKWPLAFAWCTRHDGDAFAMVDRASFNVFAPHLPKIVSAVTATNDTSLIPVVVMLDKRKAGLRWLQSKRDDRALPPSLLETAEVPVDEHARPFFRPPPTSPAPPKPAPLKPKSKAEVIMYFLEQQAIDDEIDVHLSQMTNEEIDADMRRAGFDPAVEHATCWIRGEVIAAMYELERDEARFWKDGDFRTRPQKKGA